MGKINSAKKHIIIPYLLIWFLINLSFLTIFPFFHTDEAWLSGLSRVMNEENSLALTEDFFDLYERHPHVIKVLYHICQILFLRLLGYSLFSMRLLSLCSGTVGLYLFYRLLLFNNKRDIFPALLVTVLFSWDIQFIYASHMARQEIITLLFMEILFLCYLKSKKKRPKAYLILTGLLTGLGAAFHPNAFIIAWPVGLLILRDFIKRKIKLQEILYYILSAAIIGLLLVLFSLILNGNFLHDYGAFGKAVGVGETIEVKLLRFPRFHQKIFHRVGGTYYLPNVKYFYYLLLPSLFVVQIRKIPGRNLLWWAIIGISLGLTILGKYSQPSMLFYFPILYGALYLVFSHFSKRKVMIPFMLIFVCLLTFSGIQLKEEIVQEKDNYKNYLSRISQSVPAKSVVLGGLNLEYYLYRGQLYDWRNLAFLKEGELPFYLTEREIEYIVIPSELKYIYTTRPTWNALYGNTAYWYPELMSYLNENALLIDKFPSPGYGTRIRAYRYKIAEETTIYQIPKDDSTRE
jgi:4-amino-4-deoxy-L-arabinose transferase-like glycosyltransferase